MMTRLHITVVLLVAAAIWVALLMLQGVVVNGVWLRPFSMVITALVIVLAVFDRWLWHLALLRGWFVRRPDVRGTWKVEMLSNWKDPATGTPTPPILAFVAIRQTFSSLSVRLYSEESASELLGADVVKAEDGSFRLAGVYRNEPLLSVRGRSPIHYGALVLDVADNPATALAGHYWTDRDTKGEIRSVGHLGTVASNYEHARRLHEDAVTRVAGSSTRAAEQGPGGS